MLLRHAKSSWADATMDDHDRPIQDKGRGRVANLAAWLDDRAIGCDLVLCSTALRTRQTLDVVLPVLGKPEVRYEPSIYEADAQALLTLLRAVGEEHDRVLLIGHDPGLQLLAIQLAMTATGDALERLKRKYPTSAFSLLSIGEANWAALAPGMGHLAVFQVPQDAPAV